MYHDVSGFSPQVAGMAKGNQVGQFVGLLVVVILAWDIAELRKRDDVVNVKSAADLLLRSVTMLALIAIAFARRALLQLPIGAIGAKRATSPQGRILYAFVERLPVGAALRVAEVMGSFGCADPGRVALQRFPAEVARLADRLRPVGIVGPGHYTLFNFPRREAGAATEVVLIAAELTGAGSPKRLTALLATDGPIASPTGVILSHLVLAHPLPFATGVAEVVLAGPYLAGWLIQSCAAVVALCRCHLPLLQKKTPRRDAQKCDLKSYARVFGTEYIAKAFSGNSSLGRMSILPRSDIGGQP